MLEVVPIPPSSSSISSNTTQPAFRILLEQMPTDAEQYLQLSVLLFEMQNEGIKQDKRFQARERLRDAIQMQSHLYNSKLSTYGYPYYDS